MYVEANDEEDEEDKAIFAAVVGKGQLVYAARRCQHLKGTNSTKQHNQWASVQSVERTRILSKPLL